MSGVGPVVENSQKIEFSVKVPPDCSGDLSLFFKMKGFKCFSAEKK